MKINTYTKSDYYNKVNNFNPQKTLGSSRIKNKDSIAFGISAREYGTSSRGNTESDLNWGLKFVEDDIQSLQNRINEKNNQISDEETRHSKDIAENNKKISAQESRNTSLTRQINDQNNTLGKQNTEITKLENKTQDLDQKINNTQMENDKLKKHKENLANGIQENNKIAEQKRQKEIELATIKNNELFQQEVESILSNPKNTLIETVLIPTKLEREGKSAVVPGGILIESESSEHTKKMFEWIAKKTNSNYITINTSDESKVGLAKKLTKIGKRSKNEFDNNKIRTFIFIENFENCATPKNENRKIISFLKNFLDTCSTDSHNTLVVPTKDSSKLDPIVSADHRFQVKVKLDNGFLKKNEFGYNSILNEINESKSMGKKLKISPINFISSNVVNKLKKIFFR